MAALLDSLKSPRAILNAAGRALGAAYGWLKTVTASIILLGATALFYVVGTIFPQGASYSEYARAGGRWLFLVDAFALLSLFTTPLFIIVALLLFLNLVICTWSRRAAVFSDPKVSGEGLIPDRAISLTQELGAAHEAIRKTLRTRLGFKAALKDTEWTVYTKGAPYGLLTWIYHAAIVVCFAGFFLTGLLAYEDSTVFRRARPDTLRPAVNGALQSLFTPRAGESGFSVLVDEIAVDYAHSPSLDYPADKFSRMAVGLGWRQPVYEIRDDSIAPKAYRARVKIIQDNRTVADETVEVNSPLRYGGYTFYLEGVEDRIRVRVNDGPITLEAREGEELIIPGIDRTVRLTDFKAGTLERLDGKVEELAPSVAVSIKGGADAYDPVGTVRLGEYISVAGKRLSLAGYEDGAAMTYRFDPGYPLVWWGGIAVLIALFARFYLSWYSFAYRVDESGGIVYVEVSVRTKGVFADPAKIIRRFETLVTAEDLKGQPIHSVSAKRRP